MATLNRSDSRFFYLNSMSFEVVIKRRMFLLGPSPNERHKDTMPY